MLEFFGADEFVVVFVMPDDEIIAREAGRTGAHDEASTFNPQLPLSRLLMCLFSLMPSGKSKATQ